MASQGTHSGARIAPTLAPLLNRPVASVSLAQRKPDGDDFKRRRKLADSPSPRPSLRYTKLQGASGQRTTHRRRAPDGHCNQINPRGSRLVDEAARNGIIAP